MNRTPRLRRIVNHPIAALIGFALILMSVVLGYVALATPAQATGSDSATPYSVTTSGVTLPAGQTFAAHGHVNIRWSGPDGSAGFHFDPNNNQPGGAWIGQSSIPWSAFGVPAGACVTWVQVHGFNEHYGEGGQEPVCLPGGDPEPVVVTEWHTWLVGPADGTQDVTWPQTYLGPGQLAPECGTKVQQDLYTGTRTQIDAILADGTLTQGEDSELVKQWLVLNGDVCATEPPTTEPPTTEPPTTEPPTTEPPTTEPPTTEPPTTEPPTTEPPITEPPTTEPPTTEPPTTEPPTTEPPTTEPPTTEPPTTEPPTTEPPTTEPPTTEPPITEPPTTEPPALIPPTSTEAPPAAAPPVQDPPAPRTGGELPETGIEPQHRAALLIAALLCAAGAVLAVASTRRSTS